MYKCKKSVKIVKTLSNRSEEPKSEFPETSKVDGESSFVSFIEFSEEASAEKQVAADRHELSEIDTLATSHCVDEGGDEAVVDGKVKVFKSLSDLRLKEEFRVELDISRVELSDIEVEGGKSRDIDVREVCYRPEQELRSHWAEVEVLVRRVDLLHVDTS